jgi:hypothetical protein
MLNMKSPSAIPGAEALSKAGFAFHGFDPLGEHEHMLFYRSGCTLARFKSSETLGVFCDEAGFHL